MATIRLSFLGPAQFSRDEQPVELKAAKAVALLAYLAVAGPQNRERLVDLLWPDSDPGAARQNLRNRLWSIRKALGEEALAADDYRLALSETVWVDLHAFEQTAAAPQEASPEQLQAALGHWRGPLLDGLQLLDAPELELWLTTAREHFGQLYLRLLESLVARQRASANWPAVIETARQALAYDYLQEPMYRVLMEAYAQQGERPEALRQYEALRAILARELGVEPLPETETLRLAILNGAVHGAPPGAMPVSAWQSERARPLAQPGEDGLAQKPARPGLAPAPVKGPDQPFVGRQAELLALDEAFREAGQGQVRVVVITGEMGIGKSRLWQTWAARLPAGQPLLATRCLDTSPSLPFSALTNLLNRPFCLERLAGSNLAPIWLSELARLIPDIRQRWPNIPAPASVPPEEEQRRMFEAFTQTFHSLAGQPLLLFIDDLHWADQTTLDCLVYLVDRLRDTPLLLAGAYRTTDAPAQLIHMVARWSREGLVRRLPLARLTLAEAAELVAALGGEASQTVQLQAQSAGNPYFLVELSRAGVNGGSPTELAELIRARLKRLPGEAQQILQAAAVLETDFDFDTLRRISRRGEEETLDALDTLLDAAILVERAEQYEFSHPLVGSIVRADLSAARRHFLHRRAAEVLETSHAANLTAIAGQLARHYAQANQPVEAARYAEMAAKRALELGALIEALAFYRQAYALDPTPARQVGLGYALIYAQGGVLEARQIMQQALATFEANDDRANIVNTCVLLALSYLPGGEGDQVLYWVERAEPYLETLDDPKAQAQLCHLKGTGWFRAGRSLAQAEAYLAQGIRLATEHGFTEIGTTCWFELGNLWVQRGDLGKAIECFSQALGMAQTSNDYYQQALSLNNLGYATYLAGDLAQARSYIEQGLIFVETHALILPRQYLYSTRGEIALAEGQPDQAESWFKRAIVEAEKYDNSAYVANLRANLALAARAQGRLDEALSLLTLARQALTGVNNPHLQTQINLWLAELHLERREPDAAEAALVRAEQQLAGAERAGLQAWAGRIRDFGF
jgi:DNA-binding SARP family transcriptional activator/tetratricopeptide (TPR) repeat protein